MSTGLTWVVFTESSTPSPASIEGNIVFNDYNEAVSFSLWYVRNYAESITNDVRFQPWIYTTSPNPNGRVIYYGGETYFQELLA